MSEPEKRKRQSAIWIRSPSLSRTGPAAGLAVDLRAAGAGQVLEEIAARAAEDPGVLLRHAHCNPEQCCSPESRPRVVAFPVELEQSAEGFAPDHLQAEAGVEFLVVMTIWPSPSGPVPYGPPVPDSAQMALKINEISQATIVNARNIATAQTNVIRPRIERKRLRCQL